jgi:hypothetical protein
MGAGKTRSCPHCKATILESLAVCPGCQHHLRFDPAAQRLVPAATPLMVEGTVRHPPGADTWEYTIVLAVKNERGEEITRQVVGVGALAPSEVRSFSLAVELFAPQAIVREMRMEPRAAAVAAPATAAAPIPTLGSKPTPGVPSAPRPAAPAVAKSPFRDPRNRPGGAGVALPRDPRPPATETHVRTFPATAVPPKDRSKS